MTESDPPKEVHLVDTTVASGQFGHGPPGEQRGHTAPLREGHAPVAMQSAKPPPPPPPPTPGAENIGRPPTASGG